MRAMAMGMKIMARRIVTATVGREDGRKVMVSMLVWLRVVVGVWSRVKVSRLGGLEWRMAMMGRG
jgi:hypothetical protein